MKNKRIQSGTISFDQGNGWVLRKYVGFLPTKKEMTDRNWKFEWMGAEGPMYGKIANEKSYHLQIVQQGPDNRSVINLNRNIKGHHQNCHITWINNPKDEFSTLYYGQVNNIEELDAVCKAVNIIN